LAAVVVVSSYGNPLGHCMPDRYRRQLVRTLRNAGVPLIEDDTYGELGFDVTRPRTLHSYDQELALEDDGESNVLLLSSFSKILAPGLRVGWIAPGRFRKEVLRQKYASSLATATPTQLHSLWQLCRTAPDWRKAKGKDYHLATLIAIIIMATLCGIVRGQRDLAAFAAKLTQAQLRALRSYLGKDGRYHAPKETTFQRVLSNLDPDAFERILHAWETQLLGPSEASGDKLTAIDGKAQCGSTPGVKNEQKPQLVSAQSLPSGRVLGTVLVETKSNEITAARELLEKIGPSDGKLIMLDALHTNQTTLRQIHQDNGADYLLPIKENHEGLLERAQQTLPTPEKAQPAAPAAGTPPLRPERATTQSRQNAASATTPAPVRYRRDRRKKPLAPREAQPASRSDQP